MRSGWVPGNGALLCRGMHWRLHGRLKGQQKGSQHTLAKGIVANCHHQLAFGDRNDDSRNLSRSLEAGKGLEDNRDLMDIIDMDFLRALEDGMEP